MSRFDLVHGSWVQFSTTAHFHFPDSNMSNVNQGSMNIIIEFATKEDISIIVMLRTGVLFLYMCICMYTRASYVRLRPSVCHNEYHFVMRNVSSS